MVRRIVDAATSRLDDFIRANKVLQPILETSDSALISKRCLDNIHEDGRLSSPEENIEYKAWVTRFDPKETKYSEELVEVLSEYCPSSDAYFRVRRLRELKEVKEGTNMY